LKEASHQGIHNKSWWQHFTHTVAHWASAQWHDALSHLADIGGKISVIAGIAAAVLAVGGLMFPPLDAAAAAAEGIAAVSGVLSAGSAAANDLTTPGHQREGLLDLGMAALPGPASKLLRKLPVSANTGVLAIKGIPRTVPLGMRDEAEFRALGAPLRKQLTELGYPNAVIRIRGSSITGVKYESGLPFDYGKRSDYDLAIADPRLFEDAGEFGARLATSRRTWPLDETRALETLGLEGVRQRMSDLMERKISFMIYKDELAIIDRGPSLRFPR
jgi:hypothetical protein